MSRKTLYILCALVWAGASAGHAQSESTLYLTLGEALERAPEANYQILIGQEALERQRQAQRRARAGLLPELSGDVSQSRSQSYFSTGVGTDDPPQPIGGAPVAVISDRFEAVLRASFTLFDVNNIADYRVARLETEVAELGLRSTVQDVLEAIADTYLTHLRNVRREETIRADIERDRALLDLARNRFDAGAATEVDVTRAEVALATNQLRLVQQETVVAQSALQLKQALNYELSRPLQVTDANLPELGEVEFSQGELSTVLAQRPEVVSERRTLERNQLALRAARWSRLPSLSVTGSYGYGGEHYDDDLDEVWAVGVGVSVPLFDGFRIEANQAEASAAVRQQQSVLRQLESQVEANYRLVVAQVRSNREAVRIAQRQVALAERELELSRVRFEEGVADNSEVVEAQAGLAQATDGLVEAEYQFYQARLSLARVRGEVRSVLASRN